MVNELKSTDSTQTKQKEIRISSSALPDVRCFGNWRLVDNFWGNKFWRAIFAVLGLIRCDHHGIAKVTQSDLIPVGICHQKVVGLQTKSSEISCYHSIKNILKKNIYCQNLILISTFIYAD